MTLGVGDRLHVVKCNHCKTFVLNEHRTWHAIECRAKRNRAKLGAMNLEKSGQLLYAVAAARRKHGRWQPPIVEHVHADGPGHARAQFLAGEDKNNVHVIEVGLAIGVFEDAQGRITA